MTKTKIMFFMPPGYMLLTLVLFILGMAVSGRLKSKFKTYSEVPLYSGLSGREVAEKMLHDNGIYDVQVISANGFLSDHYNPGEKTVNLSPDVFEGRSIASAAVAAHECGHALQHASAYSMLNLRTALVPAVQISSTLAQWLIIAGIGIMGFGHGSQLVLLIGIVLFSVSTVFSLITLPVEYDASARALKWLDSSGITNRGEHDKAADALKWAARTYVVAAIASVSQLVYYIMLFSGRRRD